MRCRSFLILPFFLFGIHLSAQQHKQVYGVVNDSAHNPIQKATLKLYSKESKDTLAIISRPDGSFKFSTVIHSHFSIEVSCTGYENFIAHYSFIESSTSIRLNTIILLPYSKVLDEVVIRNAPSVTIKTDTIEYKADSFKVRPDAYVEDLLKKLPGISVAKDGTITAQGKQVSKIKVNGKDFFGGNTKTATQELLSNVVDKVQVIDDYGDLAAITGIKNGDADKVINLQLKKDKNKGIFGRAETGYGSSDSYSASLSSNHFNKETEFSFIAKSNNINNGIQANNIKANAGMIPFTNLTASASGSSGNSINSTGPQQIAGNAPQGLNTTHSMGTNFRFDFGHRSSIYGSYSFAKGNSYGFSEIVRQLSYPASVYFNHQHNDFESTVYSHQAYLNFEMYFDSFTYVKISPNVFYSNSKSNRSSFFDYMNTGIKTSEGYLLDTTNSYVPNVGVDILFNKQFKKAGRNLSIRVGQSTYSINTKSIKPGLTRIFDTQGSNNNLFQNQVIDLNGNSKSLSLDVSYSEPLSKANSIDFTFSHSFYKSLNGYKTFEHDAVSGNDSLLASLSNQFISNYTNDRVGIYIRSVKRRFNYNLGIAILPETAYNHTGEKSSNHKPSHVINIAPVARLTKSFAATKSISLGYSGNSRRPNYFQLQPVRDISNIQYQQEGNPNLKSSFFHNLNLSYNSFNLLKGRTFFSGLAINTAHNKIVNNTILLGSSGAQLNKFENLNGGYNVSGFYNFTKSYDLNKFVFNFSGWASYNRDPVLVNSQKVINTRWFISQNASFTFTNKWLEAVTGVNYGFSGSRSILNQLKGINVNTWTASQDVRMDLPGNLVLKYSFEYIINNGTIADGLNQFVLLNSTIEKKILKKRPLFLSVAGVNLLNQNSSFSKQFSENTYTEIRSLQLNRYILFSLIYRWNKF